MGLKLSHFSDDNPHIAHGELDGIPFAFEADENGWRVMIGRVWEYAQGHGHRIARFTPALARSAIYGAIARYRLDQRETGDAMPSRAAEAI